MVSEREKLKGPEDDAGETPEQAAESAKLRKAMAEVEAQGLQQEVGLEKPVDDAEKLRNLESELSKLRDNASLNDCNKYFKEIRKRKEYADSCEELSPELFTWAVKNNKSENFFTALATVNGGMSAEIIIYGLTPIVLYC